MYLKRYRRASVQDALRAASQELGPEAMVLSTELVAAQGWRGWVGLREVLLTASVDRPVSAIRPSPGADPEHIATPPVTDSVVARLIASGIERALAESVAAEIPDRERRQLSGATLCRALAGALTSMVADDDTYARAEVFIGPPGVGKTTTIAKIAARERAGRGRTLGMVAADGFRAGAVEQLRIYATIIGSPFRVARTADELEKAMAAGRQPLLVDTAGRSPSDTGTRELFRLIARRRHVRTHLVLAADTSPASARRILDAYEDARPSRVVLTKLDEAESVTPLLSLLRERGLPLSYLCAGQRVPEDLERATPALVAAAMLRESSVARERVS
jgi:flagellar biosynthesis protein FlhF